ncbi:MAG TPA: sugar transferase, partial [Actinomycetota bacterium]|nr:sugar transferase [Actinomycetota bacterium]
LTVSAVEDSGSIFKKVAYAYAIAAALATVVQLGNGRVLLAVAVAAAPILTVGRAVAYAFERRARSQGQKARTLVVGAGDIARRVVATLDSHSEYGLEVVGAVDDDPKYKASELGTRLIGDTSSLPDLIRSHEISNVIVSFSSGDQANMVSVMRAAMTAGATVWVVPRLFELGGAGTSDHLWGLPLVKLQPPARSRPEWFFKRAIDYVLAGIGAVILAPVMALIALGVYVEAGRPIFLRQRRVGLDGRAFDILKFRTMHEADPNTEGTEWAADADRTTRLGRFLRDTSLDELPQLFNVLKGDMSLVGPRPERPYFVDLFSQTYPQYYSRHRLPAGLTGWAQCHGLRGSETSIEERAAFDNFYIENWALSQDVKIMFKTLALLLKR